MLQSTNQFSHPPSLKVFFATEMWERYGFYVVQSLLTLYLAYHFKWEDQRNYALAGSFTALTYLSPVVGGWIADHLLGQKKAILTGAVFLFLSYISLFLFRSELGLAAALSGIAVGTGLLKPNISSLLGNEYPQTSPKRESGFTIFYMGINIGIILGTTLPSHINHYFGWNATFASAAIGMIIAFAVFYFGIRHYKINDYHEVDFKLVNLIKATLLMALLWVISFFILNYHGFADAAFSLVVLSSLVYLIYSVKCESSAQAKQTMVIGLLCVISAMFWAFYWQMFLSLTLCISRVVQPKFFGIIFPTPYYISIQSFGLIIFGYLISRGRKKTLLSLAQSGIATSNKFLLSMILMMLAFFIITISCYWNQGDHLIFPLYFICAYLMISIAELLLSPVGLSAITVLASRKKVSTMMGIFLVSLGIGGFFGGKLANLTAVKADNLSIVELKLHYAHAFTNILGIALIATIISIILNRVIKYLLRDHITA